MKEIGLLSDDTGDKGILCRSLKIPVSRYISPFERRSIRRLAPIALQRLIQGLCSISTLLCVSAFLRLAANIKYRIASGSSNSCAELYRFNPKCLPRGPFPTAVATLVEGAGQRLSGVRRDQAQVLHHVLPHPARDAQTPRKCQFFRCGRCAYRTTFL